ncbi:MAG: ATP-binding protein [SAR324 cluster bacterium]|nr:ATP-binding protein [SAR324 cluster bacterium]
MSNRFVELSQKNINDAMTALLCPKICDIIQERASGHCMRITDLADEIMTSVCKETRRLIPEDNVFVLSHHQDKDKPHLITSTKLVELRNPQADGELRSPLLIFIPTSLRTSAEDSFSVATFEELAFTDIYQELIEEILLRIPVSLVGAVKDILSITSESKWMFSDEVNQVKFLLTAIENGVDGETIGASLYELALIPDFTLFQDPARLTGRIHRNIESVRILTNSHKSIRGRVAEVGLKDKKLAMNLSAFFEQNEVHEPESWTRRIALEKNWWDISFDKWSFIEEIALDKISLTIKSTDLPVISADEKSGDLEGLVGQQLLVPNDRKKMNVVFEVNPHPKKINGLDHFSVQIMSQVGGPVGKSKKVKAWTPKRAHCTVNISKLNKIEFEEGWHYIRVLPWTAEGDPVPMSDAEDASDSFRPFESEPFYVLPGGSLEEDPPQRAIPFEKSLEHAGIKLQLTALGDDRDPGDIAVTSVNWAERTKTNRTVKQELLIVKFGREGALKVPVSSTLKVIEQRILSRPKHPSGWRMQINLDTPELPSEIGLQLPDSTEMQSFLFAREVLFQAIRQEELELISQGFSFYHHKDLCLNYAEAYFHLIQSTVHKAENSSGKNLQSALKALKKILSVDSVHVVLTDYRGKRREALIVAPTHPLRILWLLGWSTLAQEWINQIKNGDKAFLSAIRAFLTGDLQAANFPVGVPVEDGRIFMAVDNINPFWCVCAPTTEVNTRGLMADLCSALGLPEPATVGTDINGAVLAEKIERYLTQHPYVKELSVNVFNPGSGNVIADALVSLQEKSDFKNLRYDLRLFSSNSESPTLGNALEELLRPGSLGKYESSDAFSVSTGNHLFSKLNLAKHDHSVFHANSHQFAAHLSILLDVFPAEELSVCPAKLSSGSLYGLIQDFDECFIDEKSGTYWQKSPRLSVNSKTETNATYRLLTRLANKISTAISAVATSSPNFNSVPMITLGLNAKERELIYQIHQISDWVFTIDRNMGIEFFDHGGLKDRPDYLIDFVPGTSSHTTHNLIISSRSTDELEAMLRPVLEIYGLSANQGQIVTILSHLRSLSGQLALKLISAETQQKEALGLALARLYLEYQGALVNQIIAPLDAHTNLYKSASVDEFDDSINLQRTDLALFDLNLDSRTIICNLVEVKCYSDVGDFSAFNQLKERISAQINQSERILQRHFDPALKEKDRPDRPLKSRELSSLLTFYLERAIRYAIFDTEAAKEARLFIETIERGYSLQFRRSAIIFDFEKTGTDSPDHEVGIEYHRIGKDLVQNLLDNCHGAVSQDSHDLEDEKSLTLSELLIPNVPRLESAAFLAPLRERTTTFDMALIHDDIDTPNKTTNTVQQDLPEPVQPIIDEKPHEKSEEKLVEPVPGSIDPIIPSTGTSNSDPVEPIGETKGKIDKKNSVKYDIMLGVNSESPQYGILGEVSGRTVALDLNHTHTISLFGVQGGGKSYTLGSAIEMATMPIENINVLPSPLSTVIFHYSPTQDYAPEFTSMNSENTVDNEINILRERYNAEPEALKDILILTPSDKVEERRKEYPDIEVKPIAFSADELKASHWKFLMGAVGNQSMYIKQVNQIMRGLRNHLTLDAIRDGIDESDLSDNLKGQAQTRLRFASEYIDDSQKLQDLIRPGRLIIVDLRDEYIEKDEALGLFVVMLQIFSEATYNGIAFNKLVVFDEAHKYIKNDDLVSGLIEVVREMRHKGTSIMVASQDPPSVPESLIELSSQIIMHKFNSPSWLKHPSCS